LSGKEDTLPPDQDASTGITTPTSVTSPLCPQHCEIDKEGTRSPAGSPDQAEDGNLGTLTSVSPVEVDDSNELNVSPEHEPTSVN